MTENIPGSVLRAKLFAKIKNPCSWGVLQTFVFLLALALPSLTWAQASCDVAVAGGTPSGIAASIQSARLGIKTCLIEESGWLGGQFIAIGSFDGGYGAGNQNGIFWEFKKRINDYYGGWGKADTCLASDTCFEPRVANLILRDMVDNTPNLQLYLNTSVTGVLKNGNLIHGLVIRTPAGESITMNTRVVIDAGLFGDVLALAGAEYSVGLDKDSVETSAPVAFVSGVTGLQPPTYTMVLRNYGRDMSLALPAGYYGWRFENWTRSGNWGWNSDNPFDQRNRFLLYLYLPNGDIVINWPIYGNDYPGTDPVSSPLLRPEVFTAMKEHSRQFLYHLQLNGHRNWALSCDSFDTADCFPPFPYIRESRRISGIYQLTETDITLTDPASYDEYSQKRFRPDAISYIDYPIDLHQVVPDECLPETGCDSALIGKGLKGRSSGSSQGAGGLHRSDTIKASIPFGVLVPKYLSGILAAEQNISVTHIANGATRLGPVCMRIGQAAGAAAALAVIRGIQPGDINLGELQDLLVSQKHALYYFTDLPGDYWAFREVQKIVGAGVLTGYPDNSFQPEDYVTRGQVAESLLTASKEPPSNSCLGTVFDDVTVDIVGEELCRFIEKLKATEITSGCRKDDPITAGNESMYCPFDYITRAQLAVLLLKSKNGPAYTPPAATGGFFKDVPQGSFAADWIEALSAEGITVGCGGGNFCPGNLVNRAQLAVFIARAVFH